MPHERSDSESSADASSGDELVFASGDDSSDANQDDELDPEDFRSHPPRQKYFQPFRFGDPPGPRMDVDENNAGQLFMEILKEPLQLLVTETNRHGQKKFEAKNKVWKEVTLPEAHDFVALCLLTGVMVKTDIKEYWTTDPIYQTPIFGKVMARDRFLDILHNLHFVDSAKATQKCWDNRDDENYDPIHKIREFFDLCFNSFFHAYAPNKQISVDEQIIVFLGRCGFKMVIKGKPHPCGVKIYALCEAKTGYNFASLIYCREKYPKQYEGCGEIYAAVWELLRKGNCFDKGHELYCDNWYTFRKLFQDLVKRKVFCCGTVKWKTGLPKKFCDKNSAFSKSMIRGDMHFLHTDICTLVNWRDSRNVIALTTLPNIVDDKTLCNRKIVVDDPDAGPRWDPHGQIAQPLMIHNYNQHMGGVDHADQMINYLLRHFRCRRWYVQVCMYLLKTAVVNIHIMKRSVLPYDQWERYTLKSCIKETIRELLDHGTHRTILPITVESIAPVETSFPRDKAQGYHFMEQIGDGKKYYRCVYHRKLHPPGKDRKTVNHRCIDCQVALCWDCWVPFHLNAFEKIV